MIVGVAVRNPVSGEVRSLPRPARHANLFREYNDRPHVIAFCVANGLQSFAGMGWPAEEISSWQQGFIDHSGRWLSRSEAYAHASEYGQPRRESSNRPLTFATAPAACSEDFW